MALRKTDALALMGNSTVEEKQLPKKRNPTDIVALSPVAEEGNRTLNSKCFVPKAGLQSWKRRANSPFFFNLRATTRILASEPTPNNSVKQAVVASARVNKVGYDTRARRYSPGLFFSGWIGDGFCVCFVLPTHPPPSVRAGLGNRPLHLWRRIRLFPKLWAGLRCSVLFFFSPYRSPPRSGVGGDLDKIDNTYWGIGPPRFSCPLFAFP